MASQPTRNSNNTTGTPVASSTGGYSSGEGEDSDVNYGPEGRGRTNTDRALTLILEERGPFVENVETLCDVIHSNPEVLQNKNLHRLRDLIKHIIEHQQQYRFGVDPDSNHLPTEEGKVPALTSGFVKLLYTGAVTSSSISDMPMPVLKVIEKSSDKKRFHVGNDECFSTITTMTAVDGDGLPVVIKTTTQLQTYIGNVKPGSVIEATRWTAVPINRAQRGNPRDIGIALVLCDYRQLGRLDLTEEDTTAWDRELAATAVPSDYAMNNEENDNSDRNRLRSDKDEEKEDSKAECTDDHRICSRYGKAFLDCICNVFPPENLVLEEIAQECHFVTDEVHELPVSRRRFLYYYWYATNVYLISGRHNRIELPGCLTAKIREMLPSSSYTGHKDAPVSLDEEVGHSSSRKKTSRKRSSGRKRRRA